MSAKEYKGVMSVAEVRRIRPDAMIVRPIYVKDTEELAGHVAFDFVQDAIGHWSSSAKANAK